MNSEKRKREGLLTQFYRQDWDKKLGDAPKSHVSGI